MAENKKKAAKKGTTGITKRISPIVSAAAALGGKMSTTTIRLPITNVYAYGVRRSLLT